MAGGSRRIRMEMLVVFLSPRYYALARAMADAWSGTRSTSVA